MLYMPKIINIDQILYQGSAKAAVIGEVAINLSEYAEVPKPATVSLPLKASESGPILHVRILTFFTWYGSFLCK